METASRKTEIQRAAALAEVDPANPSRAKRAGPLQQPKAALQPVAIAAPTLISFSFTFLPPVLDGACHPEAQDPVAVIGHRAPAIGCPAAPPFVQPGAAPDDEIEPGVARVRALGQEAGAHHALRRPFRVGLRALPVVVR